MAEDIKVNAEVLAVYPNKIKIEVKEINNFKVAGEKLSVGSYLRISDSDDCAIMAIIDNFCIEKDPDNERHYVIECIPIGFLNNDGKFLRGGNNIAIPPIGVEPARKEEIQKIYNQVEDRKKFIFSKLSQDDSIIVPVDGDRFFNKHVAIVGSTGCGKSCTIAKIIQEATEAKESKYEGLNNSHIIIFDIHDEYSEAFPKANYINIDNLVLPYWLMNSEELEEMFIESQEQNSHNQISQFKLAVIKNKEKHNPQIKVDYDTPVYFSIEEVHRFISNQNKATKDAKTRELKIVNIEKYAGKPIEHILFEEISFEDKVTGKINDGPYTGDFDKFVSRISTKLNDERLGFLLKPRKKDNKEYKTEDFFELIKHYLGYKEKNNITIIDLSGVPFEVLSITVSLISRIIFEYGYFFKKAEKNNKTPFLVVYEEAHRYVPKIQSAKYKSSRIAIERIAKEGRKYGITLIILSQRPSEISETIFSQCNNFIAMRLTNPDDQNYVKRLLPDSLGPLTESLPILESGDALIIGDSIVMPSLVTINRCTTEPSSKDIPYFQEWKKNWFDVKFDTIKSKWIK